MPRKLKEFVTLPEAIEQALPIPPDEARKLISDALSDGTLREEPWTVIGEAEIARRTAEGSIDYIPPHARTPGRWVPDAWRERLRRDEVNWNTGDVLISKFERRTFKPHFARKEIDAIFAGLRAVRKGVAKQHASQSAVSAFVLKAADGNKTQPQIQSEAEIHFAGLERTMPRHLFREAWKQLPNGKTLKQGKKPAKSK
jgi:hypothetical protein